MTRAETEALLQRMSALEDRLEVAEGRLVIARRALVAQGSDLKLTVRTVEAIAACTGMSDGQPWAHPKPSHLRVVR